MYQVCVRLTRFVWTCFIQLHLKRNMSPTFCGLNHSNIYSGSPTNFIFIMDPKEQIVVSNCLWFDSGSVFSSDMMLLKYEHLGAAPALPHIVEVFHFFQSTFIEFPIPGIAEPDNFAQQKNTWSNIKSSSPVTFDLDRFENLCDYSVEEGRLQKKSGLNLV